MAKMPDLATTTELCRVLGDATRVRLLALLTEHELTVAELTEVTQLPQPRVSTHLRRLRDAALVRDRRVGSSSYYSADQAGLTGLWKDVVANTDDPLLAQDLERVPAVLAARSSNKSWADTVAGSMAGATARAEPGSPWPAPWSGSPASVASSTSPAATAPWRSSSPPRPSRWCAST